MDERGSRSAISGFRLTDRARLTELGTWIDAIGRDGRRAGALRFDPTVTGRPGVRDRLVSAALTDRRVIQGGLTGLVPVADLVTAGDELWLLTSHQVTPVLSELMASAAMDATSAAAVLVETAQTLLAVHAAGLAHGAVHPGTIVIADDGSSVLTERGLADAIRGQSPSVARDVLAWAALAKGLAATWAKGTPRAAELLEQAAATATTHGLAAARDLVVNGRAALPGGLIGREVLAEIARRWSALDVATQGMAPRDEGEIATLLHVPEIAPRFSGPIGTGTPQSAPLHAAPLHAAPPAGGAPYGPKPGAVLPGGLPGAAGAANAAGAAGAAGAGAPGTVPPRDAISTTPPNAGPPVAPPAGPPETTAERIWREGRFEGVEMTPRAGRAKRAAKARRRRTIISSAIAALVV